MLRSQAQAKAIMFPMPTSGSIDPDRGVAVEEAGKACQTA
jgi:hypothetical protein